SYACLTRIHVDLSYCFFFSSRRRHTRFSRDWSSDVCSSDLGLVSWAGVAVSLMAAYVGSGYGLAGVVYGVSLGWFLRIVVAAFRSEERRVGGECVGRWLLVV